MAQISNIVVKQRRQRKARAMSFQIFITALTILFVVLAFISIFLMLFLLKKETVFCFLQEETVFFVFYSKRPCLCLFVTEWTE